VLAVTGDPGGDGSDDELAADVIASTRESVTAALMDLRRQKVIEVERGRIVILDPQETGQDRAPMSSGARGLIQIRHRPSGRAERGQI
jgi:hypothetical protein